MADTPQRPRLGGYISDDAYDGWATFAHRHGVTMTALLESVGLVLATLDERARTIDVRALVTSARGIAADRNSRRFRRPPG